MATDPASELFETTDATEAAAADTADTVVAPDDWQSVAAIAIRVLPLSVLAPRDPAARARYARLRRLVRHERERAARIAGSGCPAAWLPSGSGEGGDVRDGQQPEPQ
jgi:hypothetical protein